MAIKKNEAPRRSLLSSMIAAVLAGTGSITIQAQEPSIPETGASSGVQEIAITGSRIRSDGMNTPTPVTVISAGQLGEMTPGNLIEAFDQLPQFLNNESPQTSINFAGAAGASNLNLRGINSKRTLVLLNGRRIVGSNRLGAVDINLLPKNMLQRVEVVTGGASAAYGTDAVSGVTNFILDTAYEGFNVRGQAGVTEREDATSYEYGFNFGTSVGNKGHLIGSFEAYDRNGVSNYDGRDWYQGWGLVTNPEWLATGEGPRQLRAPQVVATNYTFGGLIGAPGTSIDRYEFNPDGSATPFQVSALSNLAGGTLSQSTVGGGSGSNIASISGGGSGLIPDNDRYSGLLYYDHAVSDSLKVFVQGIFGQNRNKAYGNSPVMFGGWAGRIYADNAFLPDDIRNTMTEEGIESFTFNRFHTPGDIGRGIMENRNQTQSYTTGFEWDVEGGFFDGWLVEGYLQWGENENRISLIDFMRPDNIFPALDAVRDPSTGEIVCNATLQGHPRYEDCAPLNLFGVGNASQAAMDYALGPDKIITEKIRQTFAEISASGIIHTGWGAGAIGAAFGASYREDTINKRVGPDDLMALSVPHNDPDNGLRGIPPAFEGHPDVHQFSGAPEIIGGYEVKELFTELQVPLISNLPAIEQLDMNLAARWADYSGSGAVWSWKGGLDWQVTQDLRLRTTLSRDIRAANLAERFDAQSQGATGDDPLFNNENYAFGQIIGGNPEVEPEEADTLTFGAIYQPSYLPGLSLSADYYEIEVAGVIEQLGIQRIIDDCHAGARQLCEQITRNPDTNRITRVHNVFLNVNEMKVNGVDFEASYQTDIDLLGGGMEMLRVRALGTYLGENSVTNLGAPKFDRAGDVGTYGLPDQRWIISSNYINGNFNAFLQARYIASGDLNTSWQQGVDIDDNTVSSVWYADLNLSYDIQDVFNGGTLNLFLNINNLFDRDPPLRPGWHSFSGATQVNQSVYDVLGRRYTAGFSFNF